LKCEKKLKIAVIGSGGREAAVIKTLLKSVDLIYAIPGNGGIAQYAECIGIQANDISGITDFCKTRGVDYVVVTPDDPLALGLVDALNAENIPCFGPTQAAARIESSKVFSKHLIIIHYRVWWENLSHSANSKSSMLLRDDKNPLKNQIH
jgi:phosphoribosylamine--glycine ligase